MAEFCWVWSRNGVSVVKASSGSRCLLAAAQGHQLGLRAQLSPTGMSANPCHKSFLITCPL